MAGPSLLNGDLFRVTACQQYVTFCKYSFGYVLRFESFIKYVNVSQMEKLNWNALR
jgi:hypothetical protein